ncbi:CaiB/BaiF CoA transferase family protein [Micromonospora sp. DT62]|uniref:CaiB/BaiF CoA transferase family protein n=1 Tax=Micromonospora sp. DT62 TaxID=3416521 RepID=UPI003CEF79BB
MSSDLHHEGPLHGVRVVEFGSLLAGPFCSQLLADFGAEVIKCEPPRQGDPMREWGQEKPHGKSLWWPIVARNKKSITVDLRTPDGQAVARRLIAQCDVVVENFRPGTMERWGLGYEQTSAENPGLIMVRVSGFGQTGPYSTRPGYGSVGEAMGGLRYVVGDPQTPPSRVGISLGDSLAGTFAALGAVMALRVRDRSGRGQVVDSAIYEAVLAMMESLLPEYALGGHVRERTGAILPNIAPSNVYPTRDDGLVLIAANQDTVFRRLAAAMDMADLSTDPRFGTHAARGRNQVELDEIISKWSEQHDTEHLMTLMVEHDVPVGQVYRAPEMLRDEHFAAREAIVRLAHPEFGEFPMQNVVPRLSMTPGKVKWVGPQLGEHTDEVLTDIVGLATSEVDELRASGVI